MEEQKDIFDFLKVNKIDSPDASYFNNLAQSIIDDKSKKKVIPLYRKPATWISVAAAAILVFLVIQFNQTSTDNSNVLLAMNELTADEIEQYVSDNIDDFDIELFEDCIALEQLEIVGDTTIKEQPKKEPKLDFESITKEEILEYLQLEEIDLEELEEESFI